MVSIQPLCTALSICITLLQNLDVNVARFRFDGVPLRGRDTPEAVDLSNDDTIELYQRQTGGFSLNELLT